MAIGSTEADEIAAYYGLSIGPNVPHLYVTSMSNDEMDIAWASTNAEKYAVYIREDDADSWKAYTEDYTSTSIRLASMPDGSPLQNGKTYQVLVQAYRGGSWSSIDAGARWITLVPSPANVTAAATGDGEVTLSWDAVEGADAYAVAELVGGSWRTYTLDCASTSYVVSDLANGVSHSFLVQARVGGRWSQVSAALCASATPSGTTRPSASAVAGDGEVTLSWARVPGAERYAVAVMEGGGWRTYTYDCAGESYVAGGLENGTRYTFLVQAYVAGAWSSFGADDYVLATPSASTSPANVTAAATGDGEVTLSWDAVEGADAYAVAELVGGSWRTYTLDCASTSYVVSDLANGVSHSFLVQARVGGRWSQVSAALCASATPSGTTRPSASAVAGDGEVTLSWARVPGAERYAVAVMEGGGWRTYTYDCAGESYVAGGLENGTRYTFLVQAYVAGARSSFGADDYV
ncbi:hypothetical protein, partial [Olsenella sp. Marseille-P4559]|uniref:hypothetical protein n=1 Tax=Olsenella sp. Marseille-P4559 TaxID=2364795 RepID=UPI001F5E8404